MEPLVNIINNICEEGFRVRESHKAPLRSLKDLPEGLRSLAEEIYSYILAKAENGVCIFSDFRWDNKDEDYIFLNRVKEAAKLMPSESDMKKMQDKNLIERITDFPSKADEAILELGALKDQVKTEIDAYKITPLCKVDSKDKLADWKTRHQEIKQRILVIHDGLVVARENRIKNGAQVKTSDLSEKLLEASCDNKTDYCNKIKQEYYDRTDQLKNLEDKLKDPKKRIDEVCTQFDSACRELSRIILSTSEYLWGYESSLKSVIDVERNQSLIAHFPSSVIEITSLTDEEDALIIKLFELIVNKNTIEKKDIEDIPVPLPGGRIKPIAIEFANSWAPCLNVLRKKEDEDLIKEFDALIKEIGKSTIEIESRTIVLSESIKYLVLYRNVELKMGNILLDSLIKDITNENNAGQPRDVVIGLNKRHLERKLQDLTENDKQETVQNILKLAEFESIFKERLLKDVKALYANRVSYSSYITNQLEYISRDKEPLIETINRRYNDKRKMVSNKTDDLRINAFDGEGADQKQHVQAFHIRSGQVSVKNSELTIFISKMDMANREYQEQYNYLYYLLENKDGTHAHFSAWRFGNWYDFYNEKPKIPKATDEMPSNQRRDSLRLTSGFDVYGDEDVPEGLQGALQYSKTMLNAQDFNQAKQALSHHYVDLIQTHAGSEADLDSSYTYDDNSQEEDRERI